MNSKHTSGPLACPHEGDPVQIGSASGRFVAMTLGTDESIATEEDYENARRLRACWNACDGIDTALLESMGTGTFVRARDRAYEDRKMYEAVLEVLRSIAEYPGGFNSVEDDGTILPRIEARATAAIEQVQSAVKRSGEFAGLQEDIKMLGHIANQAATAIVMCATAQRDTLSDEDTMSPPAAHLPTVVANMYLELRLVEIELAGWVEECPSQMNKDMIQRLLSVREVLHKASGQKS